MHSPQCSRHCLLVLLLIVLLSQLREEAEAATNGAAPGKDRDKDEPRRFMEMQVRWARAEVGDQGLGCSKCWLQCWVSGGLRPLRRWHVLRETVARVRTQITFPASYCSQAVTEQLACGQPRPCADTRCCQHTFPLLSIPDAPGS